jgi:hypothetical protein
MTHRPESEPDIGYCGRRAINQGKCAPLDAADREDSFPDQKAVV